MLTFSSLGSSSTPSIWSEQIKTSDVFISSKTIFEIGPLLGNKSTIKVIHSAVHDVFLSSRPTRAEAFRSVFDFFDSTFPKELRGKPQPQQGGQHTQQQTQQPILDQQQGQEPASHAPAAAVEDDTSFGGDDEEEHPHVAHHTHDNQPSPPHDDRHVYSHVPVLNSRGEDGEGDGDGLDENDDVSFGDSD
jgi:hypothetical protein